MSRRMALARIAFGLLLVALLYGGPYAYGRATADDKLAKLPGRQHEPARTSW